eukprot:2864095-Rhodomonas_salina.5
METQQQARITCGSMASSGSQRVSEKLAEADEYLQDVLGAGGGKLSAFTFVLPPLLIGDDDAKDEWVSLP